MSSKSVVDCAEAGPFLAAQAAAKAAIASGVGNREQMTSAE